MAQAQRYLKAFGIFSAGSLVTYSALNCETLTRKKDFFGKALPVQEVPKIRPEDREQVVERISDPKLDKVLERCRTKLDAWKTQKCVPGMVVAVSVKGNQVWSYASGLADIENNVRCTEQTSMRIASISKAVTSVYLMKMVEEGKLDLDKPIRDYLTAEEWPDKQWEGQPVDITLRQLAAHTAGIRNYKHVDPKDFYDAEFLSTKVYKTAVDCLNIFKEDPLINKPGTTYAYTTLGWTLISAVMESQLQPRNFGPAFQTFISTEMGLRNTFLDQNEDFIPNRSKYYYVYGSKLLNCPPVSNSCKWAGGGLVSTVGDLIQFGNLMLYSSTSGSKLPGFLTQAQVAEMWKPAPETITKGKFSGYGVGWQSIQDGSAKIAYGPEAPVGTAAFHGGAAVGASSILLIEPKKEIVVAIITNLQSINPSEMAHVLVNEFQQLKA